MTRFEKQYRYRRLSQGGNPAIWLAFLFALMIFLGFIAILFWTSRFGDQTLFDLFSDMRTNHGDMRNLDLDSSSQLNSKPFPAKEFYKRNEIWGVLENVSFHRPVEGEQWSHQVRADFRFTKGRPTSHTYELVFEVYVDDELVNVEKEALLKNEGTVEKNFFLGTNAEATIAVYIGRQSNVRSCVPCSSIVIEEGGRADSSPVVHFRPRTETSVVTLHEPELILANGESSDRLRCRFTVDDESYQQKMDKRPNSPDVYQICVEDKFGTISVFTVDRIRRSLSGNIVIDNQHFRLQPEERWENRLPLRVFMAKRKQVRGLPKTPGVLEKLDVISNVLVFE